MLCVIGCCIISRMLTEQVRCKAHSIVIPYRPFGVMYVMHYDDVIMGAIASQITSLTIVYSIVYAGTDQRKHQSSASLAFVRGIHRGPVNSPHKGPVTRRMFPFDDAVMVRNEIMDAMLWGTVYALTRVLFWCLSYFGVYDKHQNTPLGNTVHSSPHQPLTLRHSRWSLLISHQTLSKRFRLYKQIVRIKNIHLSARWI